MSARGPSSALPIIAIGASAGGLEAASRLLDVISEQASAASNEGGPNRNARDLNAAAFILVQHLDPTHQSLLTELLAEHTTMTVVEASDGCPLAPGHVYVIPPGRYLSVRAGSLHLTALQSQVGARLPFDHLLRSLAENCGPQTVAVVLSGTGADGSGGLSDVRNAGGFVIAQKAEEAEYPGMPLSAIQTGLVDRILRLAEMPGALVERIRENVACGSVGTSARATDRDPAANAPDISGGDRTLGMAAILAYLKETTSQDFSQYKAGTIGRRIERRMGLLAIPSGDVAGYLDLLRHKPAERDLLAQDLLINVTGFFRDAAVFDALEKTIIPELIGKLSAQQALRIWVAGCSSGEEAYSLAMICRDAVVAADRAIKVQIFASDIDANAIATAREGLYSADNVVGVPAERLARYFTLDDAGYRIAPTLRSDIAFTVQNVLSDPPFSRMDLVSCRNLLIYLNPEAQARAISLFHFALREGGILLLGASETVGRAEGRFEPIGDGGRFYRHIARSRPGEAGFPFSFGEALPRLATASPDLPAANPISLADICGRAVLTRHAPAAVLISRQRHVVFSMGPTERYLRIAPGYASLDLLDLTAPTLRARLRQAIDAVLKTGNRVKTGPSRLHIDGGKVWFHIEVEILGVQDQDLLLVTFIDERIDERATASPGTHAESIRIAELERELQTTQNELLASIQERETSNQEQKAINEAALSVNEEFQSTNEELLTSKEELQSLNEELTALNGQLQETLGRQRQASDDLQNVLYSTNVGTLFLDMDLKIRFFTPAIKALFAVIPGDLGRPLADLSPASSDRGLLADARKVVADKVPIECEITGAGGVWFLRRIFPYLTHGGEVEGVVITFADITTRKQIDSALVAAKLEAERANIAKSRFLAAASHDLRQPLQALILLQDLLAQSIEGDKPQQLLRRFDLTLHSMVEMLNALLDINQIETGAVRPVTEVFAVSDLFKRLHDEFDTMTRARNLDLRVLPSRAIVESDPRLLEQMIRNLLGNAIKYTRHGRIILCCRRRGQQLRIEVRDTGIGIARDQLDKIFDEFHQVGNVARERSQGLGLGLSIVHRLGHLLGHEVDVRSTPGKGSVFAITVPLRTDVEVAPKRRVPATQGGRIGGRPRSRIVVVDDDPDVLELLEQLLSTAGYSVQGATTADIAFSLATESGIRPELVLTDFNLPNGSDGLQLVAKLRTTLGQSLPAIILTGDIATDTLVRIAEQNCVHLSKPVDPRELVQLIERLCSRGAPQAPAEGKPVAPPAESPGSSAPPTATTYLIDDDQGIRSSIRELLERSGRAVHDFESAEAFLAAYHPGQEACLLVDAHLPGMGGVELLRTLRSRGDHVPVVLITGDGDIGLAVEAMRTGACDFIEKPVSRVELLFSIARALDQSRDIRMTDAINEAAAAHVAELTTRQREVMALVLAGHPSKNIAADLRISQRTVENHRAAIMHRMGVRSLPELARMVLRAEGVDGAAS